jgi:hypothetical protein
MGGGQSRERGCSRLLFAATTHLCDILEDRLVQVLLARLLGVRPADYIGAVRNCLFTMEGSLLSGESLNNELRVLVHPNLGKRRARMY